MRAVADARAIGMIVVGRQAVLRIFGGIMRIGVPVADTVLPGRIIIWSSMVAVDRIGECGYQHAQIRAAFPQQRADEERDRFALSVTFQPHDVDPRWHVIRNGESEIPPKPPNFTTIQINLKQYIVQA